MNQKRRRSLNWDKEEKQLLRSVLKEYAKIIENKSLDSNSNKIKIKAWEEVHKKFNLLNSRHRQLNELKLQWKTMKINARKLVATLKNKVRKTGGGPRPKTPDDAKVEIKYLLNPEELLRDHNEYDSDGLHSKTNYVVEPISDNLENQQIALSQDEKISNTTTPITKETEEKTVLNGNLMVNTNKEKYLKSKLDHGDYISSMISQSKILKDKEHIRRMEMAEEEHAIAMSIQKEKLKCAILEREILELKKAREEKYILNNN